MPFSMQNGSKRLLKNSDPQSSVKLFKCLSVCCSANDTNDSSTGKTTSLYLDDSGYMNRIDE